MKLQRNKQKGKTYIFRTTCPIGHIMHTAHFRDHSKWPCFNECEYGYNNCPDNKTALTNNEQKKHKYE